MSPVALRFLLLASGLLVASVLIYVRAVAEGAPPAAALTAVGVTVIIALSVYGIVGARRHRGLPAQHGKYVIRALIAFAVLNAIVTVLVLLVLPKSEMRTPAMVSGFWTILPVVIAAAIRRRRRSQ